MDSHRDLHLSLGDTVHGTSVTLDSLRGHPALLLFFNVGCAGCVGRALPYAQRLAERYPALHVVAIHSQFKDGPPPLDELRQIIAYWGLTFPVVLDEGDATYRTVGAEGTPHWVILNERGAVWRSFFGSMEGARHRLDYALTELLGEGVRHE